MTRTRDETRGAAAPSHETLLDELRPRAFGIAYRMLGSVADAEDVVQEALLRVHGALRRGERIDHPAAFVGTVTTRLAIDALRAARARRESYVGEWVPEPLVSDGGAEAARTAEVANSLSLAFLVLLESLSPEQRAALLLRDVFDYEYGEIAAVIGTSEANARQLTARARRRVAERRPRFEAPPARRDALAQRFFAAARDGDLAALEALLAEDVVLRGDGGGKVATIARPLHGRFVVARAVAAWMGRAMHEEGLTLRPVEVNGQSGAMALERDGSLRSVMALDVADDRIQSLTFVANPDKLRHVRPPRDADAPPAPPADDDSHDTTHRT
jgi:RNA polymerase sigma-70 factor (TIGR02957 family)